MRIKKLQQLEIRNDINRQYVGEVYDAMFNSDDPDRINLESLISMIREEGMSEGESYVNLERFAIRLQTNLYQAMVKYDQDKFNALKTS